MHSCTHMAWSSLSNTYDWWVQLTSSDNIWSWLLPQAFLKHTNLVYFWIELLSCWKELKNRGSNSVLRDTTRNVHCVSLDYFQESLQSHFQVYFAHYEFTIHHSVVSPNSPTKEAVHADTLHIIVFSLLNVSSTRPLRPMCDPLDRCSSTQHPPSARPPDTRPTLTHSQTAHRPPARRSPAGKPPAQHPPTRRSLDACPTLTRP
jgi:hypothetical protein